MTNSLVSNPYSISAAIENGLLIDLKSKDIDIIKLTEKYFKNSVYLTNTLWEILEIAINNKKHPTNFITILNDIFYMQKFGNKINNSTIIFSVTISGAGRKKTFDLKFIVKCDDALIPFITIGLANEDFDKLSPIEKKLSSGKNTYFKIGDILYLSYGHEQTNISFYQVIELKGKSTVLLKEIAASTRKISDLAGYKRPIKDCYINDEILAVRANKNGEAKLQGKLISKVSIEKDIYKEYYFSTYG